MGYKRLFIITAPILKPKVEDIISELKGQIDFDIYIYRNAEPAVSDFKEALHEAQAFDADSVIGVGGGSVLDIAKLVATLVHSSQQVENLFGKGFVEKRGVWFGCIPTTSGTGSEVSPNAILLDERDGQKKGIVSEHLMANVAYIDPEWTWTVPAKVTAETGMDALTHCIEAYTNKFAHPLVDMYAMMGIRLIVKNLLRAVKDGNDKEAREAMSLGSMYGGLCLGPVNTAAVHALSYPIGGEFHKSHGLSNAVLLPTVMRFNIPANTQKYTEIALACGCETAEEGVKFIEQLSKDCGIPQTLTEIGIPQSAVPGMAKSAMDCQRLLRNNPREVTEQDCINIYNSLY